MDSTSDERPQQRSSTAAVTMSDVLGLPDGERDLVSWMMRQGTVSYAQARAAFSDNDAVLQDWLDALVAAGFIETSTADGETRYTVRVASRPARRATARVDLWKAIED